MIKAVESAGHGTRYVVSTTTIDGVRSGKARALAAPVAPGLSAPRQGPAGRGTTARPPAPCAQALGPDKTLDGHKLEPVPAFQRSQPVRGLAGPRTGGERVNRPPRAQDPEKETFCQIFAFGDQCHMLCPGGLPYGGFPRISVFCWWI